MGRTEKAALDCGPGDLQQEVGSPSSPARLSIRVSGVVQGVGFRPFVYNLAVKNSLAGYVCNSGGIVEIEVQGGRGCLELFMDGLKHEAPPLSRIDRLETREISLQKGISESGFEIRESRSLDGQKKTVPPDTATCTDCLRELFDPDDRRFRYPFVNCTNCGPRFTIIGSLPYDRPGTTMADFVMCRQCRREYEDPSNRRFHAQPNACPACGPHLSFFRTSESGAGLISNSEEALSLAVERLRAGEIIAVKGLGGFHLMCDADCEDAVSRLRLRKEREAKPLAVMMRDLEMVRMYCDTSANEENLLSGVKRPIVLTKKRQDLKLATGLAPGVCNLGVMLPYTPLHHLLLSDFGEPLVATSGNHCDEPIAIENEEAVEHLSGIADGFLTHNRSILSRYDDSVTRVSDHREILIRRSRGYAPLPLRLPFRARTPVLACGGHLKNTFCLISGDSAYVSQHIGDLDNEDALAHYFDALERFESLFSISPQLVVHDLHPDYLTTSVANDLSKSRNLEKVAVQHHHAHIVSCMAEHHIVGPVIGVAFDGLGYGADGTLWGGEFLLCEWSRFERRAHFEPVPLPGGSAGIKQPWRMALSYLMSNKSLHRNLADVFIDSLSGLVEPRTAMLVKQQIEKRFNSPMTSSCGRLFDAISAVLGVCLEASYEGQAAAELEALALSHPAFRYAGGDGASAAESNHYSYELLPSQEGLVIRTCGIVEEAMTDLQSGGSRSFIAAKFHFTVAHIILRVCKLLSDETGVKNICLSGGVFQNVLLLNESEQLLRSAGFGVFFPQALPANDGGLSLGQAVIALTGMKEIELEVGD